MTVFVQGKHDEKKKDMKDFVKYTLATVFGLFITGVLMFFFTIVAVVGMVASGSSVATVGQGSVFRLTLDGELQEDAAEDPLGELMGERYGKISLRNVLTAIEAARENPDVCGMYVEAKGLAAATPAMAQELRQAIENFKKSGKFVYAYGDAYSQTCYYICSAADKVVLNPQGMIDWRGMASQPIFYKDLLEKIGVRMQVFKVGTYKSAVEPYTGTRMSEENRMQVASYLNDMWATMLSEVSLSRGIPSTRLNEYADSLCALRPAEDLVRAGLADTLCYADGMSALLRAATGKKEGIIPMTGVKELVAYAASREQKGDKIAVYYAYGDIVDRKDEWSDAAIEAGAMCRDLKKLREDKDIKAVVLRVNSGGGSAYASEQIWHEVELLRKAKPVVVSMGGMAASGAYYLSCAANYIVAEPNTLTGSIGIFGMVPDGSRLMSEKLGLHFDVVKTNEYADFGTVSRPFNTAEAGMMQNYVQRGYELFTRRVSDGRRMRPDSVEVLAEGRVWTGRQAVANGLADANGSLGTAVEKAAQLAKLKDYRTEAYPAPKAWYESLLNDRKESYINGMLKERFGAYYAPLTNLERIERMTRIQARLPFEPNFMN